MKQELYEELAIKVLEYNEIFRFSKDYNREGNMVTTIQHIFNVTKYTGRVTNNEPTKHALIKWVTLDDIRKMEKSKRSDALNAWLDYLGNN